MTLRARLFLDFVCPHLPEPPARVLEVGCGQGELASALAERGFDVVAIDPEAPEGPIFHRVALEDFSDERGFDAVVASVSLHHIQDLAGALDKIASFLPPAGVLALEEFARERLAGATAVWYYERRRALAQAGNAESEVPDDFTEWERQTKDGHADIHPASAIRAELETRFTERILDWSPYLYSWRLDDAIEPLERRLIAEGSIEATGFWYVGERR
ncbi:MAG TPA: class I SAM-dependent methyltransferase [Gaiellaceae bacterium]|nr:class I SAM-dependent methyltransferase [Gaiellaceae bacterium]